MSLEDIASFLSDRTTISFDAGVLRKVARSKEHLDKVASEEIVYGINTGFGPMAHTYIHPVKQRELQYNLVRSHAVGQGVMLDIRFVRIMMLLRLQTLAQGYSGVSPAVLHGLALFIEKDITPVVFEHGSVGASGDLVQLAHIALALIGEGEVFADGRRMKTSAAFKRYGIRPVPLTGRDGLALINGTSAMTAIAAVNLIEAERLVTHAIASSACLLEIVGANVESIHPLVSRLRPHKGQVEVARELTDFLKGSKSIRAKRTHTIPRAGEKGTAPLLGNAVQEIYSLRCVPQIIGPVVDALSAARLVVETEMNAVTDNPTISPHQGVIHSGNFHGDYVAFEMDKVKIAMTKLSLLSERQLNFLCNARLNGVLPPFVTLGTPGLDLGFQGLQFVATSTTAENQTLSVPMSVHTIPTNNDNQDVVSMGTNAALMANRVIENAYQIQTILLAAIAQAIDFLNMRDRLGKGTRQAYSAIRRVCPAFTKDHPFLHRDIATMAIALKKEAPRRYQQR